jgi:FG-GAP repeat
MRTNRRQFLELASAAGAAFPFTAANTLAQQFSPIETINKRAGTSASAGPLRPFDGSSLKGWHVHGPATWSAAGGELLAHGPEGWLELEQGLQDFALNFSFQANGAEVGLLVRNAPVNWSRFSHPAERSDRTQGIYVALTGAHAGAMSVLTMAGEWRQVEHQPIPAIPNEEPGADKVYQGNCAPIPCAGINDAEAAATGWPPEPPVRITPGTDGWAAVEIYLRGPACPWVKTGIADALEARSQFGAVALHVSGGQATVRFRDALLFDLTQRLAAFAGAEKRAGARQLTDLFYAEGVSAGDVNRDGYDEVVAGPFYYLGPDFRVARELYPPQTINLQGPYEYGNYSNCFLSYVHDFTGDGWPDVLMIMGFGLRPDFSAHLFLNPKGEARHWDNYNVVPVVSSETTQLVDIDGDGKPELIMTQGDLVGYAKPDGADPTKPWTFHPVSEKAPRAPHGLGVGDLNGDGRLDIILATGWWEQPPAGTGGLWKFHPAPFGAPEAGFFLRGGADILLYDVNGDGVPDVITSLNAHGPGLAWFEQQRDPQGNISWKRHLIMGDPNTPLANRTDWEETDKTVAFTELHAVALADLDGDGGVSIVTGKRWWSHGYVYNENGIADPPVLYRFKLARKDGGRVDWIPSLIDDASGVGTQIMALDIDHDGRIEILTTARKGTFVFRYPAKA